MYISSLNNPILDFLMKFDFHQKGKQIYLYNSNNKLTQTFEFSQIGLPEYVEKIDAVLRLKVNEAKEVYIFSGKQFWE